LISGGLALVALAGWHAPVLAAEVSLSYVRYAELRPPSAPVDEPAPGPRASARALELSPAGDAVRMRVSWRVDAPRPGWLDVVLAGPGVTVDTLTWRGAPAAAHTGPEGTRVTLWVDGPGQLVLDGTHADDPGRGGVDLSLWPAARGTARVAPGWTLQGSGVAQLGPGRFGATGAEMTLKPSPRRARGDTLATALVGMGVTVTDSEARVEGRLVWQLARGALPAVAFTAPQAGADLEVEGPLVASWERSGDRVAVELRDDAAARIELTVRWTVPVPEGEASSLAVPQLEPEAAFRTSRALQVARDGEVEVVPSAPGWQARPPSRLPPWGRGLVQGAATSAYVTSGTEPARLQLYRFQPVSQPPTLVDVQQITAALSEEGRVLMRVHYAVRNDRGAFLRVEPPEGTRILGAVVAGETAEPARDGEAWLLPLKKSVETVQGLLSFPVQLVIVGERSAWSRREQRTLPLPTVDAEVAVSQVTLHLPPRYRPTHDDDEHGTVAAFSEGEGITYGFAVGDSRAAEADRRFQQAVTAWMSNEFDEAQGYLDELTEMGAGNDNVRRLQSNLDLLSGGGGGGDDASVALERRVKDQAKARALDDTRKQQEVLDKAEQYAIAGEYEKAEEAYGDALRLGEKLSKLDQAEDMGNAFRNEEVKRKLSQTKTLKKNKASSSSKAYRQEQERQVREEAARRDEEESRRRLEAEEAARAAAEARVRAGAAAPPPLVQIREDRIEIRAPATAPFDPSYDRSEHLPPPIPLVVDEPKPEPLPIVDGIAVPGIAVEDGEADAVQTEASGAAVAPPVDEEPAAYDFDDDVIEGELVRPDSAATSSEEIVVLQRSRPSLRLPKLGGRKKKPAPAAVPEAVAAPPPPAEPPPPARSQPLPAEDDAPRGPTLGGEVLEEVPAGRSYREVVGYAPGPSDGKQKEKAGKRARRREAAEEAQIRAAIDKPEITIIMGSDDELPDVKATSLDVIVPANGATVRYQRHLVPADAPQGVRIEARRTRRNKP